MPTNEAVAAAMNNPDDMRETLETLAEGDFRLAYEEATGRPPTMAVVRQFLASIEGAIDATVGFQDDPLDDADHVDRVARVLTVAAANASVVAAVDAGTPLTWITMLDDRVRDIHRPLHGVTVAAGESWIVGGVPMQYPGQPVGPPEGWINCRCRADVGAITSAAESPASEGIVVVARPRSEGGFAVEGGLPADELHVTLGYYGSVNDAPDGLRERLSKWVTSNTIDAEATVGGVARMGNDDPPATALLLEHADLANLRNTLTLVAMPDMTHPHFTPHMTLGYGLDVPAAFPEKVALDSLELWWGAERNPEVDVTAAVTCAHGLTASCEACEYEAESLVAVSEEPWSNFSASDYTIEQWKRACLIKMPGGDPDSKSTYKLPVRTPSGAVSRAGVHAAAAALAGARGGVNAPAAQKESARSKLRGLYRQLKEDPPESLAADGEAVIAAPARVPVPANTHDAPGWLTHPRETQRLRNYWTKGAGAAKIRWGTEGDLTRCQRQLAKYVGPFAWGTCQNLHHVVFGYFNPESRGRRGMAASAEEDAMNEMIDAAFAAAADLEDDMPRPIEWFQDPHLDGPTPLTVTSDGRVFGHLATWGTCHVGIEGSCVEAPKSARDYAYFRTGEVDTDGGPVSVGSITMDTGHAGKDADPQTTVRHYDDTGTVVADVAAGEDPHGIWIAGELRPGVNEDQLRALRAGALSGDWRRISGNLELVAALVVNVPGFPIPRTEMAASGDRVLSLVAAAVVTVDPNAELANSVATLVLSKLDDREKRVELTSRAAAVLDTMRPYREERIAALVASVGD